MEKTDFTAEEQAAHLERVSDPVKGDAYVHGSEEGSVEHDALRTRRFLRKVDKRLIPLCAVIYLLNYLDRGNIGNAKILNSETGDDLLQQTHMSAHQYSVALSVFGIAYGLFDVPSNLIMKRYVRPSRWLTCLALGWGALTLGFAWVNNFATVTGLRFVIGMIEAGFFPGIVFLITFWYRPEERSIRIAIVNASATLAGAFGGCIAYGVGHLNRRHGMEGFRWLFVIEGCITIAVSSLIIFVVPDWPAKAKWLTEDEKRFAEERLEEFGGGYTKEHTTRKELLDTAFTSRMPFHYLAFLLNIIPLGSLAYFAPTIVNGLGYTSIKAQLMTVPPWVIGWVFSLFIAWSSDHFNARGYHIAAASTIGGIGFLAAGILPADAYARRYGCLILASCGGFPSASPMAAWVTCNAPTVKAVGLAAGLNNAMSGIAYIICVWLWKSTEAKRGYPTGNYTCAACSFLVAIFAIGLRTHYSKLNKINKPDSAGKHRKWLL